MGHAIRVGRPSLFKSFSRSQIASAVATAVDFAILFSLVEFFGVWYVIAVAVGTLAGGITNFVVNRHWSFGARHLHWHGQALRYSLISAASLVLNTAGVYALTEYGGVHYSISVALIALAVGIFFNFPLQRGYVFK